MNKFIYTSDNHTAEYLRNSGYKCVQVRVRGGNR